MKPPKTALILSLALLAGCTENNTTQPRSTTTIASVPATEEIDAKDIMQNLSEYRRDYLILDVREPSEYAQGHIPGAVNIPSGYIPSRIKELDPQKPIITVCRSGVTAASVAKTLNLDGFTAKSMKGGMQAWQGPVEK
jgi:rhodanese-related sulfurtransferase